MQRIIALLLALTLAACGVALPPADSATWTSTAQGVTATWRWVPIESMPGIAGRAQYWPRCDIALARSLDVGGNLAGHLPFVAAHEFGHCLQHVYGIPGISRCDVREYACNPKEGWADTYAIAYVKSCGQSPEPLWRGDQCVPEPWSVYREYKESHP